MFLADIKVSLSHTPSSSPAPHALPLSKINKVCPQMRIEKRMTSHLHFEGKTILHCISRYLSTGFRSAVVEVVKLRNYTFHLTFSHETFVEK